MTCKDCLYEPQCILRISYGMGDDDGKELTDMEKRCEPFKNKADYAEVKHARWKGAGMGDYECTGCWEVFSGGNRFKRCPNCGAIMDAMSLSEFLTGSERSDT